MYHFIMSRPILSDTLDASVIDQCLSQWQALYDQLVKLGCSIDLMPDVPYVEDFYAVYRHGLIMDEMIMISYLKNVKQQYGPYLLAAMREHPQLSRYKMLTTKPHPDHQTPLPFRGNADVILIDDTILFGYGMHSALEVANDLSMKTTKRVIDLQIQSPAEHLVDAILPINDGQILCDLHALDSNSTRVLAEIFSVKAIADSPDTKPTHALMIDNHAIVANDCYATQEYLSSIGYDVHPIAFDYFQRRGFGPRALVLQNILTSKATIE